MNPVLKTNDYRFFAPLFLYSLLIFIGICFHEQWRDEAQAWLIARDLSFFEIPFFAGYEGKPMLWHLLLMPFAKLNFPYFTELIVHSLFAIAAVLVFLRYAPFPYIIKILLTFSYFLLYEYGIPAKSYVISVFLLFSLASLYQKRFEKPLLFGILALLLCNTNVHSAGLAGGLFMIYFMDWLKNPKCTNKVFYQFAIPAIFGAFLLLYQVFPSPDGFYHEMRGGVGNFEVLVSNLKRAIFPLFYKFNFYLKIISGIFFVFILFLSSRSIKIFLFICIELVWLSFIYLNFHPGSLRHIGFIWVTFILSFWLLHHEKIKIPFILKGQRSLAIFGIVVILVPSVWEGINQWLKDYNNPFSNSYEASNLIKENETYNYPFYAGHPGIVCQSVLPYFTDKNIYNLYTQKWESYKLWDIKFGNAKNTKWKIIEDRLAEVKDTTSKPFVFITTSNRNLKTIDAKFLGETKGEPIKEEEDYKIYLINSSQK